METKNKMTEKLNVTQALIEFIQSHDMKKSVNLMTLAVITATEIPRDQRHGDKKQEFLRAVSVAAQNIGVAYTTTAEDITNIGLWLITNAESVRDADTKETKL